MSVQMGFYMTLAAVPLFYVGYSFAYGSEDNFLARQYQKYKEGRKEGEDTDRLHQAVVSQAILDRARLSSYPRETTGPDLNYPEYGTVPASKVTNGNTNTTCRMFNAGSPWNQAVGQGADMRQLEEYYGRVRAQAEEERIARMKDGKVVSVYDSPPLTK